MLTMYWGSKSWPTFLFLVFLPAPLAATPHRGPRRHFSCVPLLHFKNKQHGGGERWGIAKPNSMHRISQASAQKPISCFRALTLTQCSRCQAGREPSPEECPPRTVRLNGPCRAAWPLPAGTELLSGSCFLRQASREGEM